MKICKTIYQTGMVYAMTNAAFGNEVVAFRRGPKGVLMRLGSFVTGGDGTGTREVSPATPDDGVDPLASQGSLILSPDGKFLFAVNAGSNTISSFLVQRSGKLILVDQVLSGGEQPNALAVFGSLLYATHVGSESNGYSSNITGFYISEDGYLIMIPDSTRTLSTPTAQPAGIVFDPCGHMLIVSELTTNRLSVFFVHMNGTVTGPIVNESIGPGPFGSTFLPSGAFLVSQAGDNALSSYRLSGDGNLFPISSVLNGQLATCWVQATPNKRFAYTSNAGSGTLTLYRIAADGTLTVVRSFLSVPGSTPLAAPIDIGVSRDGNNLYVLNGNKGTVSVFYILPDGVLTLLQVIRGLPELGSQGIAVL